MQTGENVLAKIPPPDTEDGALIMESLRRQLGPSEKDVSPVVFAIPQYVQITRYLELQARKSELSKSVDCVEAEMNRLKALLVEAVGNSHLATYEDSVEFEGVWTKNANYGCQLQVERWSEIIPPTLEGIRGYLSSGLLKGIGEKTAEAIVQRFGLNWLEVIEKHPERLLEIRGITEEKLENIKNGYAESKVMRDLMTILAPFKVTPATAMKIYQHFGPGGSGPYSEESLPLVPDSRLRVQTRRCHRPEVGW